MKQSRKLWLLGCLLAATPLYAQQAGTTAWNEFDTNSDKNVLLDFSYAGYNHGLSLPDENHSGYTTYNVVDYGAIPNDGKSDREALKKIITAIGKPMLAPLSISRRVNLFFIQLRMTLMMLKLARRSQSVSTLLWGR